MPNKVLFRHKVEYYLFALGVWLANHLPARFIDGLSAAIWRVLAPRLHRHRRAITNLKAAMPELTISDREAVLDRMWDNLGRTSVEALALHKIADDPNAVTLSFSEDVIAIMKSEQPAIFVSLHMGNWEVPALAAEKYGKPLIGVYQKILNPLIDQAVHNLRARFYKGGLYSKGLETITKVRRGIANGYSIAIMADLRDSHGAFVDFFNLPTSVTTFPALLSRLYNMPIVAIRAIRTDGRKFQIDAVKLDLHRLSDRDEEILENTKRIQSQFERWIREDPSLWLWGHRRWNF
jgi:Kdo2-lipid IVA lauroyltransferase/acyltransferase